MIPVVADLLTRQTSLKDVDENHKVKKKTIEDGPERRRAKWRAAWRGVASFGCLPMVPGELEAQGNGFGASHGVSLTPLTQFAFLGPLVAQ